MNEKEDKDALTEKIAQQIKAYLAAGNRITYIPRDVTVIRETKKYTKGWKGLAVVGKKANQKGE
jgi:hypothetical protein